jgi:hypothetical protein
MKITRGVRRTASRVVIHGVEGIGKSTLAAQFPNPLVLDTEDGTNHLDVARVTCTDWATLEGSLHDLARDRQGFQTVVIDSIDWAERQLIDHLLAKANKRSIEDFGFGKGYTMVGEAMARLLDVCDTLVHAGLNVVLVGHTKVARTSPPDMDEGYDRFELKLTKQSGPLVKEWADAILFANYKTRLVEGQDGRTRARGGKERVLHTERTAAWDAKNRCGLPPELPMTIEALASLFADVPAPQPVAKPKGWRERIAEAATNDDLLDLRLSVRDSGEAGKLTKSQCETLFDLIEQRMNSFTTEAVEHDAPAGA